MIHQSSPLTLTLLLSACGSDATLSEEASDRAEESETTGVQALVSERRTTAESAVTLGSRISAMQGVERSYGQVAETTTVYGKALALGESPLSAAESFKSSVGEVVGVRADELRLEGDPRPLMVDPETGEARFTLFQFQQQRGELRVHQAKLKVLVNNATKSVVWSSSALRDLGEFEPLAETEAAVPDLNASRLAAQRVLRVQQDSMPDLTAARSNVPRFSHLTRTSRIIYVADVDGEKSPLTALQYETPEEEGAWSFVSDAVTGEVLEVTQRQQHLVWGAVSGTAVGAGGIPHTCAPLQPGPLPHAEVSSSSGQLVYADENSFFSIANAPTFSSRVTGQYFELEDPRGIASRTEVSNGSSFFPGHGYSGPADQAVLEQVTVYRALSAARKFVERHAPGYPGLDTQITVVLDVEPSSSSCSSRQMAWAAPSRISFCAAGQNTVPYDFSVGSGLLFQDIGWNSGAIPTTAYHEYGHVLIYRATDLPSTGGLYHEGMAEVVDVLIAGTAQTGHGLYTEVRHIDPVDGSRGPNLIEHDCAPVHDSNNDCVLNSSSEGCNNARALTGAIWDLTQTLRQADPLGYRDTVARLTLNSISLQDTGTIDSRIAQNFLLLDDAGDNNPSNGTPNGAAICAAFSAHGFDCQVNTPTHVCANLCGNQNVVDNCWCDVSCQLGQYDDCCSPTGEQHGARFFSGVSATCPEF